MAIENESDDTFEAMLSQMLPPVPSVSKMSGTLFEKPFDVTLTIPEGATVYYTLDNTDPTLYGQVYTKDTAIRMEEGATMLRAVAYQGGLYSKEQLQTYNVAREIPDMPRASPTSGTYDSVRKVTLSADKGTTIYYTMDGTHPTEASMPYTEPITLRIGKTILRAVAVSVDGKYSSEMIVEYKCDGRTKTSMDDKDTISGLKLFSTTQSDFEAAYGPPLSSSPDGENILGVYTRCDYDFGYVVFLDRGGEKGPVLAELVTDSASFEGPRGIGIGSRMEDVIAAFRDEGGEANIQGNRVLYTLTVGKIGLLEKLGESDYKISYFHKLDNGQYIELTYHVAGGLVTRMEWLQYTPG